MTEALLVLNPREISECIDAIQGLPIAKCWLSFMGEPRVANEINAVVRATSFDRYVILSDDTVPTPEALEAVLAAHDQDHPVVTGYCNLDARLPEVNLTRNRLPAPPPTIASYEFMRRHDVERSKARLLWTTFAGLSLTCITRDLLLNHPMHVSSHGGQMDYTLSYSLQQAGVPIWAARDAFVWHVKETWNMLDTSPEKRLLVGVRKPSVTWTDLDLAVAA